MSVALGLEVACRARGGRTTIVVPFASESLPDVWSGPASLPTMVEAVCDDRRGSDGPSSAASLITALSEEASLPETRVDTVCEDRRGLDDAPSRPEPSTAPLVMGTLSTAWVVAVCEGGGRVDTSVARLARIKFRVMRTAGITTGSTGGTSGKRGRQMLHPREKHTKLT
jgi:hypothetical protein